MLQIVSIKYWSRLFIFLIFVNTLSQLNYKLYTKGDELYEENINCVYILYTDIFSIMQ